MDIEKAKKVFPKFFENFGYKIPEGAKEENIEVYRLCLNGVIDREAFIGTYETIFIKKTNKNKDVPKDSTNPSHYSTSCFEKKKDARRKLICFTKYFPKVIMAKGITAKECGPCQRTKDREKINTSHIDWWIYENSHPEKYFLEVDNDE